jgi:hypothetical protein
MGTQHLHARTTHGFFIKVHAALLALVCTFFGLFRKFRENTGSESSWTGQYSFSQQIEFRPTVHLPLDELQTINLAFGLAVAPNVTQCVTNRGEISPKSVGKTNQSRNSAVFHRFHPTIELILFTLSNHSHPEKQPSVGVIFSLGTLRIYRSKSRFKR